MSIQLKQQIEQPIYSLDPGERTFQTLYGMDHVITFGNTMRQSIEKKLFKIDEMKSKLDKYNNRKKRKKKSMNRQHNKIKNIKDELHYKICLYLCRNYDRIMVTDFSSKKVSKKEGNLNRISKRNYHIIDLDNAFRINVRNMIVNI